MFIDRRSMSVEISHEFLISPFVAKIWTLYNVRASSLRLNLVCNHWTKDCLAGELQLTTTAALQYK